MNAGSDSGGRVHGRRCDTSQAGRRGRRGVGVTEVGRWLLRARAGRWTARSPRARWPRSTQKGAASAPTRTGQLQRYALTVRLNPDLGVRNPGLGVRMRSSYSNTRRCAVSSFRLRPYASTLVWACAPTLVWIPWIPPSLSWTRPLARSVLAVLGLPCAPATFEPAGSAAGQALLVDVRNPHAPRRRRHALASSNADSRARSVRVDQMRLRIQHRIRLGRVEANEALVVGCPAEPHRAGGGKWGGCGSFPPGYRASNYTNLMPRICPV